MKFGRTRTRGQRGVNRGVGQGGAIMLGKRCTRGDGGRSKPGRGSVR